MTAWLDYINNLNTDFDDDSPIYSSINVGTGLVLNGNLRQTQGEIQATGVKLDNVSLTTVQTGDESFVDNNTSIMTSAAIQDKIESYGYSTTTGDITGVTAGTGLSGGGTSGSVTLNVSGVTLSEIAGASIITSSESFADNDTTVMTSAAIQDKIESYGYTTATGDITGVTAGTGLSGGGASGAVTLNVSGLTVSEFAGATIQTSGESFADNDTSLMTSAAIDDRINAATPSVSDLEVSNFAASAIQTGSESFADNDTTLMTSAAVQDKIEAYGYITGVTNISGNAATATALETARNIGGVSFNGTANINLPGVNTSGNQDTSGNAATATALETARTIGGVSFDGTGNINLPGVNTAGSQDTSGNAATATTLATARNIAGTSFNGSANIDIDANNLSGSTLNSGITASSLTSVGTLNHDLTIGDTLILTGDSTSHVSNNTTSGREILQLRGKTQTADSAGINLYGDGDSSNPGKIICFNSDATSMQIMADGRMKWGGGSDWKNWTPVWTNLTIGNAAVSAKYQVVDETVFWLLKVVFGSTSSVSSSTVSCTLPLETNNSTTYQNLAQCWLRPQGTASSIYNGPCISYNDKIYFYAVYAGASWAYTGNLRGYIPQTWNTSGIIYAHGQYRTDEW